MTAITFDTLAYSNKLQDAGMSREQADAMAKAQAEAMKELVAALLGIPLESIETFTIKNPEMPPENLGDKFCRLDINMTVNGQ